MAVKILLYWVRIYIYTNKLSVCLSVEWRHYKDWAVCKLKKKKKTKKRKKNWKIKEKRKTKKIKSVCIKISCLSVCPHMTSKLFHHIPIQKRMYTSWSSWVVERYVPGFRSEKFQVRTLNTKEEKKTKKGKNYKKN